MTTNTKRAIVNTAATLFASLVIVGIWNAGDMLAVFHYINAHTTTAMAVIFYSVWAGIAFILPLLVGFILEVPMWNSRTNIGFIFSNAMSNARNGVGSFIAVGALGGILLSLSVWGFTVLAC